MIGDRWVSRRDCHEKCMWWERDESVEGNDELIMQRAPSGTFMAKEIAPEYYDNGVVGGSFMYDRATTTIRTPDNVEGLKNNCIVKYRDEKWFVVSVQRKNIRNNMTEFAPENFVPHYYIIQLRR